MTTDQPLGTVLRDGTRRGLRYVRTYAHPREKVWRAITESQHLRHWMPADARVVDVGRRCPAVRARRGRRRRAAHTTWLETTDAADGPSVADTSAGYHLCLDLLEDLLDGDPQPTGSIPDDVEENMRARYAAATDGEG